MIRELIEKLDASAMRKAEIGWPSYCIEAGEGLRFVVNVKDFSYGAFVEYGWATVSNWPGEEEERKRTGIDRIHCIVYGVQKLNGKEDWNSAVENIQSMYQQHCSSNKEALMTFSKAWRKRFLQTFANPMKELGFKKKGNAWQRALEDGVELRFDLQKSMYNEEYYLNISLRPRDFVGIPCYHTRVSYDGKFGFEWQLMCEEEWNELLRISIEEHLKPILNMPLEELGNRETVWLNCHCKRNCCEKCWVKKNYWEAIGKKE